VEHVRRSHLPGLVITFLHKDNLLPVKLWIFCGEEGEAPRAVGASPKRCIRLRRLRRLRNSYAKRAVRINRGGSRQVKPWWKLQYRLEWASVDFVDEDGFSGGDSRARALASYPQFRAFNLDLEIVTLHSTQLETHN
jgi:hypothetical protein